MLSFTSATIFSHMKYVDLEMLMLHITSYMSLDQQMYCTFNLWRYYKFCDKLSYCTFEEVPHFEHAISPAEPPARLSAASLSHQVQSDTMRSPEIPIQHEPARGTGLQSARPSRKRKNIFIHLFTHWSIDWSTHIHRWLILWLRFGFSDVFSKAMRVCVYGLYLQVL